MKKKISILTLCILYAGIINSNAADRPVNVLIYEGLGIKVAKTENEIIGIYGKPQKRSSREIDNPYYDFNDAVVQIDYSGYVFYFFQHKHPENGWSSLTQVTITDKTAKLKFGLNIGISKKNVISILGTPDEERLSSEGGYYLFYFPVLKPSDPRFPSEHQQLRLLVDDGKLVEVSFLNWP